MFRTNSRLVADFAIHMRMKHLLRLAIIPGLFSFLIGFFT